MWNGLHAVGTGVNVQLACEQAPSEGGKKIRRSKA